MKPYKQLYRMIACVACKFGIESLKTLNESDFSEAVKHHFGIEWKDDFADVTKAFLGWCKKELMNHKQQTMLELFENIRYRMMQLWETEIVQPSAEFKKAKIEK
jgi:hypothetical protein